MSVDMTGWIEAWDSRRRLVATAGAVSVVALFVALLSFNLLVVLVLVLERGRGTAGAHRHGPLRRRPLAEEGRRGTAGAHRHGRGVPRTVARALPVWLRAMRAPEPSSFASRVEDGFGLAGVQCDTGDAAVEHGMPLEDGGYSCIAVDGRRFLTLRMHVRGGTVSFRDIGTGRMLEPLDGGTKDRK